MFNIKYAKITITPFIAIRQGITFHIRLLYLGLYVVLYVFCIIAMNIFLKPITRKSKWFSLDIQRNVKSNGDSEC